MNKRQKKALVKRCGFYHYDKELVRKLKKGYVFPWVSTEGPHRIPLCLPPACVICRFCSDVFLDWNGPYAVICRKHHDIDGCHSFMLDTDYELFHPDDHAGIDDYIKRIRSTYDPNKTMLKPMDMDANPFLPEIDIDELLKYVKEQQNNSDALDALTDAVRQSVNNIGVPPELIFGPDESNNNNKEE